MPIVWCGDLARSAFREGAELFEANAEQRDCPLCRSHASQLYLVASHGAELRFAVLSAQEGSVKQSGKLPFAADSPRVQGPLVVAVVRAALVLHSVALHVWVCT